MPLPPVSSGWRTTSSPWRRHAGRSSRKRTPLWAATLARPRHLAAADPPRIREGMVGRATWAGRDQRRAVAGETGDTVDARGFNGLGEGHAGQDGGEPACQHRLPRPGGAEQKDIVVTMPA